MSLLAADVMQLKTFALQGTPYAEIVRIAEADPCEMIAIATAAPGIAPLREHAVRKRMARNSRFGIRIERV